MPSPTFISSYLSAFRPRELLLSVEETLLMSPTDDKPTLPENPSQGDQTLLLAFEAQTAADYAHAMSFASEAIEQGISWKQGQAEAYNMRGTYK